MSENEQNKSQDQKKLGQGEGFQQQPEKIDKTLLDFLPAVLEIQQRPPSALGRAISWSIIGLTIVAFIWAYFGKIDIVANAQGKIIPAGYTKVIQPLEGGIIKRILVKDGQRVKKGELLVVLDKTLSQADLTSVQEQKGLVESDITRLNRILDAMEKDPYVLDEEISGAQGAQRALGTQGAKKSLQSRLFQAQIKSYNNKLAQLDAKRKELESESASILENINKLKKLLPIVTKRVNAVKSLLDKNLASENDFLELEQQRINVAYELSFSEKKYETSQQQMEVLAKEKAQTIFDFKSSVLNELKEKTSNLSKLEQDLVKAKKITANTELRSPIDGLVEQLKLHTVGGVVTSAQELMAIVPQDKLAIEAWVLNKDIGFIQAGQEVEIKVEAFPFTEYGLIPGQVEEISSDAVQNEKIGWVFQSSVSMERDHVIVEGKKVNLQPGMTVNIEIKIGKRRLIEFFLAPLLKYKQESLKER